jgi:alpha-tubulin suppressor-like RCC1 family protein
VDVLKRPRLKLLVPILGALACAYVLAGTAADAQSTTDVYRWGSYLGGSYVGTEDAPFAVPGLSDVVAVDAGNEDTYALQCVGGQSSCSADGTVWDEGNDDIGQIGNGISPSTDWLTTPAQVQFPVPNTFIVSIGENQSGGYAVDSNGNGWAWGHDSCSGQTSAIDTSTPVEVPGIIDATAVQGGQGHVLWLLANGSIEACGDNNDGQLGNGTTTASYTPTQIDDPATSAPFNDIVSISAGNVTSAALDSSGNVYMWGSNTFGQIGIDKNSSPTKAKKVKVPTKVPLPYKALEISAGGSEKTANGSSIALLDDSGVNVVYAWGNDKYGQLGDDKTTNEFAPVKMTTTPKGVAFTEVVSGGWTSYGLSQGDVAYAWGAGGQGQLGNGTYDTMSLKPTKVDSGVIEISSTANNVVDLHMSS